MPKRALVLDLGTGALDSAITAILPQPVLQGFVGGGDVTMLPGVTVLYTTGGSITGNDTAILAAANSYPPGTRVLIVDSTQAISGGTLAVEPTGADVLYSYAVLKQPLAYVELITDGVSAWQISGGSVDVLEDFGSGTTFSYPTIHNAGATAPTQGTTWNGIGNTEFVTKGAVSLRAQVARITSLTYYANNSTSLVNTGLTLPLGVGTHEVDALVYFGTNNNTPGNKFRFNFSGTATGDIEWPEYRSNGGTPTVIVPGAFGTTYAPTADASGSTAAFARLRAIISVTAAGSITFQYAQITAHASNSGLRAGSIIRSVQLSDA